ncbi:unnamed protein product, partial [Brenthis ino]
MIKVSAINDPAVDIDYICYLIKFDSTHGKFKGNVTYTDNAIVVNGKRITIFREKLPSSIPWQSADVQYVVEASGMFTCLEKAMGHLANETVKRVVVTAPSVDVPMLILGVNEQSINTEHKVISCASSTLYCLAPIIKILEQNYGVSEGFITSIHAMTPSLKPLDGLCLRGKHWRDHRSIHQNIIPAATGACKALSKIIPQVKDKMSGIAFRVPIVNVSVLDITIRLNKNIGIEDIFKRIDIESKTTMKNIIKLCTDEAVSSDFLGDEHSCIIDVKSSLQLTPNFYKLICWYENEYSYACRVIDCIRFSEKSFHTDLISKVNSNRLLSKTLFQDKSVPYMRQSIINSSQDIYFKPKLPTQIVINNALPLRNKSSNQSTRKITNADIFKICNDGAKLDLPFVRDNKNSQFNSCVDFRPYSLDLLKYNKNQERLQKAKQEVSKMMDMTENLLKETNQYNKRNSFSKSGEDNSNVSKIYKNVFKSPLKDVVPSIKYDNEFKMENVSLKPESILANEDILNGAVESSKSSKLNVPPIDQQEKTTDQTTSCIIDVKNGIFELQLQSSIKNNTSIDVLHNYKQDASDDFKGSTSIANVTKSDDTKLIIEENILEIVNNAEKGTDKKKEMRKKILEGIIKKLSVEKIYCPTSTRTDIAMRKDNNIYDKLDSASNSDSENSFQMNERKSQVIDLTDLTNSAEDLSRLDKICRIIEISDELSDNLFSALDNTHDLKREKWSFKDLCERLKLDEFCNKIFGQTMEDKIF